MVGQLFAPTLKGVGAVSKKRSETGGAFPCSGRREESWKSGVPPVSPNEQPRAESAAFESGLPLVPPALPRPPRRILWQFQCQTNSKDDDRKRENAGENRRFSEQSLIALKRLRKLCTCGCECRFDTIEAAENRAERCGDSHRRPHQPAPFRAAHLAGASGTAWPFTLGSARWA